MQRITFRNCYVHTRHCFQYLIAISPIFLIYFDPLDEKIIVTDIVSQIAVERKDQIWS
jgi:hypothetical protein